MLMNHKSVFRAFLCGIACSWVMLVVEAQESSSEVRSLQSTPFKEIRMGVFEDDSHVAEEVAIPEGQGAVRIRLETESPTHMDLDLFVYENDPESDSFQLPLCVSDGLGYEELCEVRRPQDGSVWVVIEHSSGVRATSYRLSHSFIPDDREPLLDAERLYPNEGPMYVDRDEAYFRLDLKSDLAVLVVRGENRQVEISSDIDESFLAYDFNNGITYYPIGISLENSNSLIEARYEPTTYLVRVGERQLGDRYSRTEIEVIQQPGADFLVRYSSADIDTKTNLRAQRRSFKGNLADEGLRVYGIELGQRPVEVNFEIAPANLQMALIDQYGYVIEAGRNLQLYPERIARYRALGRSATSTTSRRKAPSRFDGLQFSGLERFYIAVLPDPWDQLQGGGDFLLSVKEIKVK